MAPKIKAPIFGTVDRGKVGAEVPYSDLIPETYFRNSLDLNRFENKVSKELIQSYNRIIIDSVRKLEAIERRPKASQPKYTAARLRSLLAQTKKSLEGWSNSSSKELIKNLDGVAKLQSEFVEEQLKKVLPAGMRSSVRSVEVSPKFAEAVVKNKATDINANVLSDDLQAAVKGVDGLRKAQGSFNLTAKMGSKITLPNGDIVSKAFRGLAEKNADLFGRTIRDGLLSGETTQQVGRRLLGKLYFGEKARTAKQLALAGGEATKMANHQISTLVRTSIQQVSDAAAQSVYKQNSDITQSYKWLATLDSRTAPQCMALDQKVFKYGQGPTPPQHFNCRCRTVATIDYEGLDIPPPNFTRSTRAAVGGPVPTGTSYGSWLQKQPPQMRAKILGGKQVTLASGKKVWRGKFQYFDKLSKKVGPDQAIAKFVSSDGSEKSLKQLQKTYGKPSNIKPKTKVKQTKALKPKVDAPVVSDFVSSKPLKKLNIEETIKSYEEYKKHQIKMSEIKYGKNYDHWTGNTDARLERLRQGLDLNSKNWPTDLDYIYWRQGFTKRPIRVKNVKALKARKDLYKGADGENLLVYRGVSNDKWSDQFKGKGSQGDLYFAGEGIYGNGSYAASRSIHSTKATLAKGNQNALTLAKNYTEPYGSKITDAQKEIRTTAFGIKKGANIKTWKKGVSTKKLNPKEPHAFPDSEWYETEFKQWQKDIKKEAEELTGLTYDSTGEAAAALGIDAYQIPLPLLDDAKGPGEYTHYNLDYWVILNRNAIVVSDTVGL